MPDDPKSALPDAPRLPQRTAIYITPDGGVKFGALFEGLLPVAEALAARSLPVAKGGRRSGPVRIGSRDPDAET